MTTTLCIATADDYRLLAYPTAADAEDRALPALRAEYPTASIMSLADYHAGATAKALAEFPLSRVTEDFYDQMLNVLPPVHRRGCPGFFVSEALTLNVHAQFISHNGRYYGGNADLSTGGRTWSIDDVDALEASLDPATPPLSWYP
jgi:hypothetical protein